MAYAAITTGDQAVTATGAVTGVVDTSAMNGDFTVRIRVRGLTAGKVLLCQLEDTANASAFSDALSQWDFAFQGGGDQDGDTRVVLKKDLKAVRFGATNTKLRVNVTSLSSSPGTPYLMAWLEL